MVPPLPAYEGGSLCCFHFKARKCLIPLVSSATKSSFHVFLLNRRLTWHYYSISLQPLWLITQLLYSALVSCNCCTYTTESPAAAPDLSEVKQGRCVNSKPTAEINVVEVSLTVPTTGDGSLIMRTWNTSLQFSSVLLLGVTQPQEC